MLQLHKLEWGNCFSYGEDNVIIFDEAKITQLVGKNGHGKSSIALILEEVLFNKNNKSIKKSDIPNRNLGNSYWIKLNFINNGKSYLIDLDRKSSLKVKLYEDGKDISSHTATGTFTSIKNILGVDFKVFSQLFYQSSTVGLMFLTSTDTNRKKFLIDLFSLEEYLKYHELYKSLHKEVSTEWDKCKGALEVTSKWLENNQHPGNYKDIISINSPDNSELSKAEVEFNNIKKTNKRIQDNNKLKEIIANIEYDKSLIDIEPLDISSAQKELGKLEVQMSNTAYRIDSAKKNLKQINIELLEEPIVDTEEFVKEIYSLKADIAIAKSEEAKLSEVQNICPTCTQEVTETFKARKIAEARESWQHAADKLEICDKELTRIKNKNQLIKSNTEAHIQNQKYQASIFQLEKELEDLSDRHKTSSKFIEDNKSKTEQILAAKQKHKDWENIYVRIDRDLPKEPLLAEELEANIRRLKEAYENSKIQYAKIQEQNNLASAHNARVKIFDETSEKYRAELEALTSKIEEFSTRATSLEILKKTFSTNGLVAYKLENLVIDLQVLANEYLATLSDGRFILEFSLDKDKLNIVIVDNGSEIGISSLSAGELARVNAATLLAIRKLMNSISKTQINLLFLDEIVNVLDDEGKEKLIEVLLEEDLNTFLVSHGWSHPMLNKIHIVKDNDISRLELE